VDRKEACLAQAEADPANRDRWVDEAIEWLERAVRSPGRVAITFEGRPSSADRDDLRRQR
jgi:hypothetical protein